jgi:very-short-patch-repair endonuclease
MIEDSIRKVAHDQGGYVTYWQLREQLGLTHDAIKHRIARHFLIIEYRGVYAVGRRPTNPIDRAHGALLACGPGAGLSHQSGGSLWGVFRSWRQPLHVSTRLDRRPKGVKTHHRPALTTRDFVIQQGLRVTTPAVTILDLAPTLTGKRLLRIVNEFRLTKRLELVELEDLLRRFPRHPGARHIRQLLRVSQQEPTRSGIEDDWPEFAARHGLTGWEMNVLVGRYRVDVLFIPDLLIVELDGPTHDLTTHRDKDQDAEILTRFGTPTLRIPVDQFTAKPAEQAARIHKILADRRARGRLPA